MKKTIISLSVASLLGSGAAMAYTPTVTTTGNNFTMVGAANGLTGGTNDVVFSWDGTYRNAVVTDGTYNATLSSVSPFAGKKWTAHHVNIYAPGTYTFYTGCPSGGVNSLTYDPTCGSGTSYTLTVPVGMVGAHMLFNWSTSIDIDVVILWDMDKSWNQTGTTSPFQVGGANTADTVWNGVSIDTPIDPDNYAGTMMVDGPFVGQSANFNINGIHAVDVTPPTLASTSPVNGATGVSPGNVTYDVTFSEPMLNVDSGSISFDHGITVGAPTTSDNITFRFPVTLPIGPAVTYTVHFNHGPTDVAGNAFDETAVPDRTFTTGAVDVVAPTLVSKSPTSNQTDVALTTDIVVTFSEPMGGSTAAAISLSHGGTPDSCTFVPDVTNTVFTCVGAKLLPTTVYTVSILDSGAGAATDTAGNVLTADPGNTWTFTTLTPPQVLLGSSPGGGGGCAANPSGRDASLPMLALIGVWYAAWRRRVD